MAALYKQFHDTNDTNDPLLTIRVTEKIKGVHKVKILVKIKIKSFSFRKDIRGGVLNNWRDTVENRRDRQR